MTIFCEFLQSKVILIIFGIILNYLPNSAEGQILSHNSPHKFAKLTNRKCFGLKVTTVFRPHNKILKRLLQLVISQLTFFFSTELQVCVSKSLETLLKIKFFFSKMKKSLNCEMKSLTVWYKLRIVKKKWDKESMDHSQVIAPYLIFDTNKNKAVTERELGLQCI